jgi:hypothetical protein
MVGRPWVFRALALVAATAGAIGAAASHAGSVPAISGTFTMTSDAGDFIGHGQSFSFPARAIEFGVEASGEVRVSIQAEGVWSARLSASDGARLEAGVYAAARRDDDAIHPGLDVFGAGRGCNETTGRFTVLGVEYGLHGYLRSLHATFEQHCDGAAPALRGEIELVAPPPPPLLDVDLTFASSRTSLDRVNTVRILGTIACSQNVPVSVSAEVTEAKDREAAIGGSSTSVQCSRSPTSWLIPVVSSNGIPFTGRTLRITLTGEATDKWYTAYEGQIVFARDVISNAEAKLPSRPHSGFVSRHPAWTLVIVLSIIATVGWSLLVVLFIRGRARPQPS